MMRLKEYAAIALAAIVFFFGKQTYDRRVGARENDRKRQDEDRERARYITERARDARSRAASDRRDPVDRVRSLGGLRDNDTGRGGTE